ncbi:MAG: class I SAM-dependent methyltransferase [Acidobacteria bacterium]|nr:class I SAM-dependent methyltransferase [Acidobacteriota bacterium]
MTTPTYPVTDTSRFMHGAIYHALYDRPLAEARGLVVDMIPEGSSVLDIACGTGELCFEPAARKKCGVVGIDLSRRMIDFARRRNPNDNVRFLHRDGADLTGFEPGVFDYATVLFLVHEVPREKQVAILNEALRVARRVALVDSEVPLPWNLHGIALRLVETTGGLHHYLSFADYLATGGIKGILADARLGASVSHRAIFWHGCRELVVLESKTVAV